RFFFQAEDGIRDFHVTGVQTCALPILLRGQPGVRAGVPAGGGARHRRGGGRGVVGERGGGRPAGAGAPRDRRGLHPPDLRRRRQIGRASCRGRVEVYG